MCLRNNGAFSAIEHVRNGGNLWRLRGSSRCVACGQGCHQTAPACVFLLLHFISLQKRQTETRKSDTWRAANVYFLFSFSIITSTCPEQEVPLWDWLVVSFIISFHSQLPSTSPGKFAPKVKWPLCSTEFSQHQCRRWSEKARKVWWTDWTRHKRRHKNQPEITSGWWHLLSNSFDDLKKKARHNWHNKAQHCWGGYSLRCYTSVKLVQQSKIIRQSHSVTQV